MVRTTEQFNAPPTMAGIVGGFVSIPVGHLLAVWFACQGLEIGIGEFRAWLASIEMVKRRTFAREGTQPTYGFAELARLLDVTQERARLLVQNLVAAGLLTWSESAITFPAPPPLPDDLLAPFADTIGRGKGSLVIPRTLLRFLASGATTAMIAVALAALLRCLSCRGGHPDGWGRLKTSWIARTFRLGERQVVAARNQLADLGWLIVEGDNRQWAMNRWGRAYRINLCWNPAAQPIARSAPPPPAPAARSAPPLLDRNPLREAEIQNQNPASGGPVGVQLSEREGGAEIPNPSATARPMILPSLPAPVVPPSPAPVVPPSPALAQSPTLATTPTRPATGSPGVSPSARPATTPRPSPAVPAPGGLPVPRLEDVRVEDLKDTARLLDLLGQAVARGLVTGSEADRLRFVGAAEHARAIGQGNPAGLFIHLVRGKLWRYLTQDDEDRANGRIKAFLRGPEPPRLASSSSRPPVRPVLSEDARVVIRVRSALASAGYRGDPFPQVRRLDPSWTRERWDRALSELEGA
jgi:hypothetical protein